LGTISISRFTAVTRRPAIQNKEFQYKVHCKEYGLDDSVSILGGRKRFYFPKIVQTISGAGVLSPRVKKVKGRFIGPFFGTAAL
jgi:hypothetical protein